jgi:phosphoserine aminotransferase
VAKEDRSRMNVCFTITQPELEKEFIDFCKKEDIVGIKGHRSVGGFRVSLYNAMPPESVQFLVESMRYFATQKV